MLIPDKLKKTVKIPVKIVDGEIIFFYGDKTPKLKDGTIGELILPDYALLDNNLKSNLQQKKNIQMLEKGVTLMVNMKNVDTQNKEFLQSLISIKSRPFSHQCAPIELLEPLFIQYRGSKNANLLNCRCSLPVLVSGVQLMLTDDSLNELKKTNMFQEIIDRLTRLSGIEFENQAIFLNAVNSVVGREITPTDQQLILKNALKIAVSLNHAYTLLSSVYETKRRSHTGNVFQFIYYKNGEHWHLIDNLRSQLEIEHEKSFYQIEQLPEKEGRLKTGNANVAFPDLYGKEEILARIRKIILRMLATRNLTSHSRMVCHEILHILLKLPFATIHSDYSILWSWRYEDDSLIHHKISLTKDRIEILSGGDPLKVVVDRWKGGTFIADFSPTPIRIIENSIRENETGNLFRYNDQFELDMLLIEWCDSLETNEVAEYYGIILTKNGEQIEEFSQQTF
ncbi:MAG: hypothetical protein HQM12_10495 [SAR324 cluster bacterium]|nr:hypothetical protein [SAR324 cluster bacterium]